jgi:uncharacterized protein (TIGR02246 family)
MQSSGNVAIAALALGVALSMPAWMALAEPKADVAAVATTWGQALADPEKVSSLYTEDAVLWGTLSPNIRSGRTAVLDYFTGVARALPGIKIDFGHQLVRVYGNAAVNSGYYTFSWVKDGETKTLPARYSFTYVKDGDRWLIVDHHSSALPSPPR